MLERSQFDDKAFIELWIHLHILVAIGIYNHQSLTLILLSSSITSNLAIRNFSN